MSLLLFVFSRRCSRTARSSRRTWPRRCSSRRQLARCGRCCTGSRRPPSSAPRCSWPARFSRSCPGPILVPVAIVMLAVRVDRRPAARRRVPGRATVEYTGRARQLAVLLGVAVGLGAGRVGAHLGVVRLPLHARSPRRRPARTRSSARSQDQPGIGGRLLATARQFHLLPEAYIYGLRLTVQFASERAAFLNGRFATTGWWWYFPYAFAVKTTIPGMIVGLLALAAIVARWKRRDGGRWWTARRRASTPARRCSRSSSSTGPSR